MTLGTRRAHTTRLWGAAVASLGCLVAACGGAADAPSTVGGAHEVGGSSSLGSTSGTQTTGGPSTMTTTTSASGAGAGAPDIAQSASGASSSGSTSGESTSMAETGTSSGAGTTGASTGATGAVGSSTGTVTSGCSGGGMQGSEGEVCDFTYFCADETIGIECARSAYDLSCACVTGGATFVTRDADCSDATDVDFMAEQCGGNPPNGDGAHADIVVTSTLEELATDVVAVRPSDCSAPTTESDGGRCSWESDCGYPLSYSCVMGGSRPMCRCEVDGVYASSHMGESLVCDTLSADDVFALCGLPVAE